MQKLIALLFVALSSVTLHAQRSGWSGVRVDPDTGLRSGLIVVLPAGDFYSINRGAILRGLDLREVGRDFSRVDLRESTIQGIDFTGANLSGSSFRGADLRLNNFSGADFSGADLVGVRSDRNFGTPSALPAGWVYQRGHFIGPGANLVGADLAGADLAGADLAGADLAGADLVGADLVGADLSGADLGEADLSEADLSRADLGEADLNGIINVGAILEHP